MNIKRLRPFSKALKFSKIVTDYREHPKECQNDFAFGNCGVVANFISELLSSLTLQGVARLDGTLEIKIPNCRANCRARTNERKMRV